MLCKPVSPGNDLLHGIDREKIPQIRDKIRVVFGKNSPVDETYLARRFALSDDGSLVMIL